MIKINKDTFNKLSIEQQIEYINKNLQDNNNSITSVTKAIGIGRSTITDRFKKRGYIYNKELKKYAYNELLEVAITTEITDDTQPLLEQVTDVSQSNTDSISEVITLTNEDMKNNLFELANNYNDIMNMLQDYRRNTSVIKKQISIDLPGAESKLVTQRVNEDVLKMFNKFCNDNKQYTKVDLLSQAILNFINEHH